MTDYDSYFQLGQHWDGEEESRLLFADLVSSDMSLDFVPSKREIPDPWPRVIFAFEGEGVEDIPFQILRWFLVSNRLKLLIEENQLTGISFYPIQANSKVSFPLPRFWYGHLRLLEGAIDFERSVYTKKDIQGDPFLLMVKYALKRTAIAEWDFFRTMEATAAIFCSSRFHDLCLENRVTGTIFRPVPVS